MYTQTNLLSIRNPFYSIEPPIRIIRRMELADRLKQAMEDCGNISQYALAPNAKVPQPTINRIIKGVSREPKRSTLEKLADALGVSRDWLITGNGNQFSSPAQPPTLNADQWGALSSKRRTIIEQVALADIKDEVIDALHAVMIAAHSGPAKTPLKLPASATGGISSSAPTPPVRFNKKRDKEA